MITIESAKNSPVENLLPDIYNAVRALIMRDGRILLLRKGGDARGERFALPGGAQEPGETLPQALDRECREEIGTGVRARDLVHVADWFKPRDTTPPSTRQTVEFVFACSIPDDYEAHNGHRPDKHQIEVVWMALDELAGAPLFPRGLREFLSREGRIYPVYLGTLET